MGYDTDQMVITVSLSNHNDERDDEHLRLWVDLTERIRQLMAEPKYEAIRPDTY